MTLLRHRLLGVLVELGLGTLDLLERLDVLAGVERAGDEVPADPDQAAQQRKIVDLRREIPGRDQRGARTGQLRQIGRAADLLHRLVRLEQGLQRDRVGDHAAVGQAKDRLIDAAVKRFEEMIGAKLQLDILHQPVVEQQGAKQRGFGLYIMGELLDRRFWGARARVEEDFGHGAILYAFRPRRQAVDNGDYVGCAEKRRWRFDEPLGAALSLPAMSILPTAGSASRLPQMA
jgi:hypothetical protein